MIQVVHTASKVTQTTLTSSGLSNPQGIAAGPSGTLIVSDVGMTQQGQLLSLVPKTATSSALPMSGLGPESDGGYGGGDLYGALVGPHGEVYAADSQNNRVLQLPVSIKPVVAIAAAPVRASLSRRRRGPA